MRTPLGKDRTMEKAQTLNVAIVGGGPGCKAITEMIFAEKRSQLRMKLIGVASTNPEAVGYCYAKEKGIYTTDDYQDLFKLKDLDMIIELTGRAEVANEISRTKPDHVRVMDHVAARLFWDVFQIEEARIVERRKAEEELSRHRDHLEELVVERTAKLTAANEQLQQEVVERKEAEKQIKEQTEFLNSVIESLPHPFCVIDALDYKIKLANSAAHAGDLTEGVTCHSLTHKSDKPCSSKEHPCPLDMTKETKRPVTVEHVHYDKDGNPRNVEVHAYPVFDSEGNVFRMIESSLDITGRKQAEQERVQREKLEGILEMAGAVCHEFNQPLQGILGFSLTVE